MSFIFEPMTEEQINALNLVDPGVYDFEVVKAENSVSKKGNPMIELKIKIWDANGREHFISDYLVSMPSMMYKVKHFCDAVGLQEKYTSGRFDAIDCEARSGKVNIIIQKGQPNPNGGTYQDKNAVKDYVHNIEVKKPLSKPLEEKSDFIDDDLPF